MNHTGLPLRPSAEVVAGVPRGLLIGGAWRESSSGRTFSVEDPATELVIASVADATVDDGVAALDAASAAQEAWSASPPRERAEILRAAYEAMTDRAEELAALVTWEMGKPLDQSRAEVRYAAEFFRWFSEEAVRIGGSWSREPGGAGRLMTTRSAVGPCLLITPWNFPLAMGTRKIGPALAAGSTCIVKPAEQTPLSMNALGALLHEVGVPPGVVNVISTTSPGPVVERILLDPRLRKLSFTGSTEVGKLLAGTASRNLLRVSMELGGNAPFVVFDDADLDVAVDQAVVAKMRNMGESCVAANRFYVHESVEDEFVERLSARLAGLTIGPGLAPGTEVGPLIDRGQVSKVRRLVREAMAQGAELMLGEEPPTAGPGHFFPPVVMRRVPQRAELHHQEIFGPVAPVYSFRDPEEVIARCNQSPFGLVGYVFTRDLDRALWAVDRLDTGMVGVNKGLVSNAAAPFGGTKQSGLGREGGAEGIDEYLCLKYVGL